MFNRRRVMGAIETCRSAALGGHVEQCDDCGQLRIAYWPSNSPPPASVPPMPTTPFLRIDDWERYVYAVAKFSRFFGCSPDRLGAGTQGLCGWV
jgi:hypothetical protein